jgi:uncharacterized protein (DUF111 family)
VPTGHGYVEIAHGRCSIPAPATGELLRDVPLAPLDVEGELTTPTGAAIVAALADEFGPLPAMKVTHIGYGAGQKDFSHPNILRLLVGEAVSTELAAEKMPVERRPRMEAIVVLETNLDTASGEAIGGAVESLWAAGALDVSITAIQMKKHRPGVLVSVQSRPADADRMEAVMFAEFPTLGVRRTLLTRTILARQVHEVHTRWGPVAGKIVYMPDGSERFSPEFESCREIADRTGTSLPDVMAAAQNAFRGAGEAKRRG